MRIFKVLSTDNYLRTQYISPDVEYTLNQITTDSVYFCRNTTEVSCSSMPTHTFKRAVRDGYIVFLDWESLLCVLKSPCSSKTC